MSAVIGNPLLLGPEGYQISRSVRLRSSASAYLSWTFGTPTNNRIWTWSGWVKRGALGSAVYGHLFSHYTSSSANNYFYFSGDTLYYGYDNGTVYALTTSAVFRDPSAWYHVVLSVDTTQATASERTKIFVNGVQQAVTGSYVPQNTLTYLNNSTKNVTIGRRSAAADQYFDGYITEINFIDGQALTPSSFGETDAVTGVWKPKKYAGTYGTNGFYLNFSDNSNNTATTIGKDYSGNGNNWTPNNISVTSGATYDSMLDVPTLYADGGNGRGNYCTLNPLDGGSSGDPTAGNLDQTVSGSSTASGDAGSFTLTSGKWYWEVTATLTSNDAAAIGILRGNLPGATAASANPSGVYYYAVNGNKYVDGTSTAYGSSWNTLSTAFNIGVALDADAGTVTFYRNGTSQGAITLPSNTLGWKAHASYLSATGSVALNYNFGQRPFTYTPPTGFKALNTQNLPDSTIKKGNQYFDATAYSGNSATQNIVNSGAMQPDLVWIKNRTNALSHYLNDSVRGAYKTLFSNLTNAEYDGTSFSDGVSTFNSNGFTLLNGTNAANYNQSANNYVAWQWKKGATQGFDIVTYTGTGANRTVAHSLGVAPKMLIGKNRSNGAYNWVVWHANMTSAAYYLNLNTTIAQTLDAGQFNSTAPTSSVFSLGTQPQINGNGDNCVMYLFSEVAGFSRMGSFTGNGSSDGSFVYLGFRPRWIMIKRTDTAEGWYIHDTSRSTYNVSAARLLPNSSAAEVSDQAIDFLSNGFKLRTSDGAINASGGTFVYAAFAENPFRNALAR